MTKCSRPLTDEGANEERVVPMRLQKFLARAGVASRRGSEDFMTGGRVCVNGVVVTELGAKVDPSTDVVTLDGVPVSIADEAVYIALYKPAGVMTTMSDPQGRTTVTSFVPVREHPGLFPVGRLDFETTGLLLFTTDGELAHRVLHPRWHVEKVYRAEVDGRITAAELGRLREGVLLDDGMTAPAQVRALRVGATSYCEITISEGRKRQVRRMFSSVGHPVIELTRVSFGPITLDSLGKGKWRYLTAKEVAELKAAVDMGEVG
ncbi:MAG: rRNA pseudouridine synthase [Coriobacteriia bacterium]|nr:rRNA pseudouridine synthase [Coriobacteriia bacterium]